MKHHTGSRGEFGDRLRLVLRHVSKGFSFIVAPHGTGTTVTFNLPGRVAMLLLVLLLVLVAGLAFVSVTYTRLAILGLETERLRAENKRLRSRDQRIGQIEEELLRIDQMRREIETWAGVTSHQAVAPVTPRFELIERVWPRRYTYAILKPHYLLKHMQPRGMIRPAAGWVSRRFILGGDGATVHPGIDIAAPKGTPVRCALDGTVISAGWDDIYVNLIEIEHNDSLSTLYGHNEKMLVKEGEYVTTGQVIASVGSTGRSTAPHLHFEVMVGGTPVDPETYVDFTKD
jgi:murein DD-endopeptidase MepM/ murein hydrolase activator NlpD